MKKKNVFFQTLICRFQDDDVSALAAQLTYYLILSFFPFLIFVAALLSFTRFSAIDALERLSLFLPEMSNQTISEVLYEIEQTRSGSLLSFGLIAALWSASNGVNAIIKGLNKAYDEEENRPFWLVRSMSLLTTVVLAVAILLSFSMLVFGRMIGEWIYHTAHLPGDFSQLWGWVQYAIPLVVLWTMFVLLYSYLPNVRLGYKAVIPGAIFATGGWIVVSMLFSFYVNHFDSYSRTYGSIGGIIVLLTWLYLSSMIILLGGQINATLHFMKTGREKPPCKAFSLSLFGWSRKST
ncbi:YihY/virulence factor BrkB family protein [Paenibacillus validus]|uniref:YihY family inner membrane protein n=1 Tax=Paenibacillus validus TaxID=44253 RepID=A0A7X2Z8T8_9BACL|nr:MULTISPECIES: YihY/virulence factor BrkB family protein [Paenibacillus]MED4604000.1 YihY/virulence factor BrkB family protein [Paenibacillus validus]MED4605794.1 YihY/virulence factor BrkB family protein [Paenibacillus validus]MUG70429.1 YihY family inner membrane protein [Paenibacillus validus]